MEDQFKCLCKTETRIYVGKCKVSNAESTNQDEGQLNKRYEIIWKISMFPIFIGLSSLKSSTGNLRLHSFR